MKKTILFFLLFPFVGINTYAQQADDEFFTKPNYKQIEKASNDASSPYYFPKLMQRYQAADSTLTLEEKRHLYYGFAFQPQYKGVDNPELNNKLAALLAKQQFGKEDYPLILAQADEILKDDPFSLRALEAQLFVYAQEDNVAGYIANVVKKRIVFDAIVSSGEGVDKKSPFYVIRIGHEFDLLGYMGYRFGGENKILKKENYLSVASNQFGIGGLYFNIEPILNYMSKH
ncbi:MAG: DUF4919 domain-containing protein [Dysgonamonadaceae bacterium]|jgi:hypothetical protein|nr:DUF4919 domain-containing protein [Dysgonamonadaceae bacterium]